MNAVKTQIVKVGNSRGVRIPKLLLDQAGLGTGVEIAVQDGELVIRTVSSPRQGWEEQFRAMAQRGHDKLLDEGVSTRWDAVEWTW